MIISWISYIDNSPTNEPKIKLIVNTTNKFYSMHFAEITLKNFMRLLILFLLIIPILGKSQELKFSLANGIAQHKEELLQPISYTGYRLGIGVNFTKKFTKNHLLFVDFLGSGALAKTNLGNDMAQLNTNLELGYLMAKKFDTWNTGFSIQSQYDYALYSLNYEYPFWYTQYSLNWYNKLKLDLTKNSNLSFFISIPIVGFFSRTEKEVFYIKKEDYNSAYFHRNMTFESLNNIQAISGGFLVSRNRVRKTDFSIGYRGNYFHYKKPKAISSIAHSIILSINLKLKNEN